MDKPDNSVIEMSIVSAQEDERIKAIAYDRMTEHTANNGLIINKNAQ